VTFGSRNLLVTFTEIQVKATQLIHNLGQSIRLDNITRDLILPADGGNCEEVLSRFAEAGINIDELAAQLQDEGAQTFVKSWNELMSVVDATGVMLEKAAV
jgi:hypothetical protein